MNPAKVRRDRLTQLTDLPNVGPATAADLKRLGIDRPDQLTGRDPLQMYQQLCELTSEVHDPCVLDVFMSLTHFANGGDARAWWDFTELRKKTWPTIPLDPSGI